MGIAAGGRIRQVIHEDLKGDKWLPHHTTVFNVQILNSLLYKWVTGVPAPGRPIDVATYAASGLPFFAHYEEPSGICGGAAFANVQSVAEIQEVKEEVVEPPVVTTSAGNPCTSE